MVFWSYSLFEDPKQEEDSRSCSGGGSKHTAWWRRWRGKESISKLMSC